ncbi:transcriptional regulator with XRE-family HTH domain [Novosphingobium fluoreni]|uniref:Transcriptional regulator with XRE-family HTH domain n=1 Tax=Novosphingobium fluoreni TaxID=1391222 RepID=A0A7W6C229_9SPHN|nr:helix-turn-helix transcriptional regulator [Novosphingobium fluoreni]MBB3940715.1 transcriptional regulator with XRE-family HTH domain [Novosphingobium fluoreni]
MTLKDWLAEQELTSAAFAARIGKTAESVRRYVNGDRIPDKETMPVIASETSGKVTANDFFGISPPALEQAEVGKSA